MTQPFAPHFIALPETLPIFPLNGVLLLPRGQLPLNIFEPRYLNMVTDTLMSSARLIGMVQPMQSEASENSWPIYPIGCAGRISAYSETEDGRLLITLTGVCRFKICDEMPIERGYRRAKAEWDHYRADFEEESAPEFDRQKMLSGLKSFFRLHEISANWEAIEHTADERLITSLAMICPFEPREKQALLEAKNLTDRAALMIALMEMAVLADRAPERPQQ